MKRRLAAFLMMLVSGGLFLTVSGNAEAKQPARSLPAIEKASGGRLGVALIEPSGRLLMGNRTNERFAMCSTFKAPLAAAILAEHDEHRLRLDHPVRFGLDDLLGHAPVARAHVKQGVLTVAELAAATVEVSDNSAANLLLPLIGGPRGLTAFMRGHGDAVTRLDRTEPTLNENRPGDPRDTTSPVAMSWLMARLLHRDLSTASTGRLRGWLMASTTGARRIRAGFPAGWTIGDKTGTCGTAYNDVAILRSPRGRDYVLAVYLDRPRVGSEQADAMIAEVGRIAARLLMVRDRR